MTRALKVLLILLLTTSIVWAQSHDAAHPTPLAPGLNKGNVDSIVGPNYYYFFAGPGHWEVHLTFHEMGLLGNPYRQLCNFDFINAHNVTSHMQIVSQGNTAKLDNSGDFTDRQRMVLKVSGQGNLIRMGGYYEVTITGAVSFEGKAGSSAGVQAAQTESLVHNVGPLVQSSGPLVKSSGPLVQSSGGPLVKSAGGPLVTPGGRLVYPGKPLIVQDTVQQLRVTLAADVLFDFGRSDIRPDAAATLRQAAAKLKTARPRGTIQVEGFTDSKGTPALNMKLSQARAESVETWLIQNAGFSVGQLSPRGYGASRPVAANANPNGSDNPAGRQANRRVEIVLTK
jgi:outer membrane protein OmpA-like peptidoglycan-associated protein